MADDGSIDGFVDPRFADVRAAFAANFEDGSELGAAFAVAGPDGLLVDLVGGYADKARTTPWSHASMVGIYSSGKAVTALLIAREVAAGRLDYDAPVAHYWPAFAAAGKETITLGMAMSHQAGLVGFADEIAPADWLDWDLTAGRVAAMAPLFAPGSASAYHPQTYGFIAGEVLRRVTGRTVGETLRADYPDLDVRCGLTDAEFDRTVDMLKPPRAPDLGEITDIRRIAFLKPWSSPARVARRDWARAEIPASNVHASASGLARLCVRFVDGTVDPAVFDVRIDGDDLVLPFHLWWAAGIMSNKSGHYGPNPRAFGHGGSGGSCIVVDPERKLSIVYVMNKMSPHLIGDPRAVRLLDAVYAAL
ncbi:MAG: serine hydrolase domain-containing protein [Pseudomonadota bacterium]